MCYCSTLRRDNQLQLIEARIKDFIGQPSRLNLNHQGREFQYIFRWFSWKTNVSCCEFKRLQDEFVRDVIVHSAEFMSARRDADVAL